MGSKPSQLVNVYSNQRSTLSTGVPAPEQILAGWPAGDQLLKSIMIAIRSNLSANTSMVTDGRLEFLRSCYFETDKHGPIIEGLDGHSLRAVSICSMPKGAGHRDSGSTVADGTHYLKIPFADDHGTRKLDKALDLLKATPKLELQFGNAADIEATGGTTLNNLDVDVCAEIDPGPVEFAKDRPIVVPHLSVLKVPISATATGYQIALPYGDRSYERIYVTQRNGSTLAALNNTVVGANTTDRISLKVNGFPWVDRRKWHILQEENRQDYDDFGATLGSSGIGVLDFAKIKSGGYFLSEALNVFDRNNGRIVLELDVTSVANGQVWIVMQGSKKIPAAAERPAPEPQKA